MYLIIKRSLKSILLIIPLIYPVSVWAKNYTKYGIGNAKTEAKANKRAISYAKSAANSKCGKGNWTSIGGYQVVKSKRSDNGYYEIKVKLNFSCN